LKVHLQRRAPARATPAATLAPAGLLQRKRACGCALTGLNGGCHCGEQKLEPSRRPEPLEVAERPSSDSTASTEARYGHSFGQVRVGNGPSADARPVAPRLRPALQEQAVDADEDTEEPHLNFVVMHAPAGEATCDIESGDVITEVNTRNCTKECTGQHEAKHKQDMGPCCQRAAKAYQAAKSDEAKERIVERMKQWGKTNRDYFEYRGYNASVVCGQKLYDTKQCTSDSPPDKTCCDVLHEYNRKMLSLRAYYEPNKDKHTGCPL